MDIFYEVIRFLISYESFILYLSALAPAFATGIVENRSYCVKMNSQAHIPTKLDICHVTSYDTCMIKTFADKETQQIFVKGGSKRLPPDLIRRAIRRLEYIDVAVVISDLRTPPSNRLHALKGNREGQFSISINEQWRICFRFIDGEAYDVEITDYH